MESTHVTLSTQSKPVDPLNDKAKAILSGALRVFTTQGYAAASMDRIASAAGVSKPTLYRYFQDKETLFVTLIQQSMQKNRQLLFNLQTAPDLQHAPDNVLRQLATSVLEEFSRNQPLSTLMRLIIGESERFPELARTFVREIQKPLLEDLSGYLAAQTQLQLPDPMVAARIFSGSIVHYLIVQEIMHGKDILPLERDRMIDGLIQLIMAAGKT
ncbi:MAG: TetR/AcrR family transcriptional regulator [Cyanobacteria bacterium J06639_16]